ncbi:predicted protein [Verticillium alfalfae VaMs.102]|uniref:Predicted protein n=1 Tax=Verticillium alfalfae (strain VaMs.102 / ATCC MYA-4576 / FGSC 10136) TaxID=526221 RepID=C9SGX6_VERA1|nr:predicted protein [Verticillium alfalfae VaMs.102]EEY18196.1 predicted protein [Verticillium alfalfae VaMs.102]
MGNPGASRPPSYASEDGVDYVVEARPRSIAPAAMMEMPTPQPVHPSEVGRLNGRQAPCYITCRKRDGGVITHPTTMSSRSDPSPRSRGRRTVPGPHTPVTGEHQERGVHHDGSVPLLFWTLGHPACGLRLFTRPCPSRSPFRFRFHQTSSLS